MVYNYLRLSQPTAVSAYTYILLMVMNFGLAWSNEQTVYLYHDTSYSRLSMQLKSKTVHTDVNNTYSEKFQRLIVSSDMNYNLTIYNEASDRFLCFAKPNKRQKHWRLVALRNPKDCSLCTFKENMTELGFHTYHYLDKAGREHYLSFNRKGKYYNNDTKSPNLTNPPELKFVLFLKIKANNYSPIPKRHHHVRHQKHICGAGRAGRGKKHQYKLRGSRVAMSP